MEKNDHDGRVLILCKNGHLINEKDKGYWFEEDGWVCPFCGMKEWGHFFVNANDETTFPDLKLKEPEKIFIDAITGRYGLLAAVYHVPLKQ